ncbi:MAG: sterol desaturase family protein [Candidatus Pacebacteria bacterium]|nr:sterol desaturase family protein [Candidatus Paceibacterota bacterium]
MGSFIEWTLHTYVMHRPIGGFTYAYNAHARVHHTRYRSDDSYHLSPEHADDTKITMAWWNGPLLIAGGWLPYLLAGMFIYHAGAPAIGLTIAITSFLACTSYYIGYEYIHWCMHCPKERWIERQRWYRRLNAHHLLHHRAQSKNMNVLFPLADWCLGTLITRAKHPFPQARGPSVPDVQP